MRNIEKRARAFVKNARARFCPEASDYSVS